MEKTEFMKVNPQAVSELAPTHLPVGRGHEDEVTQDDFEIPRAKIVQFTSEEAQAADPADRVLPGTLINSVSKTTISPVFIPIFRYKTYVRWNPMKKDDYNFDPAYEPGDLIFSTTDRHDTRIGNGLEFGPEGQPPKVTQVINFLAKFENVRTPMVLSFQKTSFKGGKRLNTLLEETGGDMFSNKFKLVAVMAESNGTKYYVLDVRANGKATQQEFLECEALYNRFRGVNVEAKAHKDAEFSE